MQAQARSRKRAADGSAPDASYPYPQQMQDGSFGANDPLANYQNPLSSDVSTTFPEFSPYANNVNNPTAPANFFPSQVPTTQPPNYAQAVAPPSNQLVRRNTNQQVARTPQRNQWSNFANSTDRVWEDMEHEEEQDLDQKAAIAKKDAQAKRKQIPPFVQKLSSFLDSSNNTELIRWSDDGNSFIVLDEDEFARTLIPELFKHNNYASFVRQLNMYGFHKKVGLNANSMKAAEKKVKDPSVYWHEYFKRGRPDLLWLIQKPAAKSSSSKRKRDQDKREPGDSDDDHKNSPDAGDGAAGLMTTIPRQDMGTFRSELQKLQRQQSVISKMITSLKEQNEQFYRQATAFQALHDRHENSINAILTFLATFYNRSLDGHSGPPNLASFLSSASMPQPPQQQGSVFDMGDGDMNESNTNNTANNQLQRYQKPRPLLLPAPGAQNVSASPFSNATPSARSSTSPGPMHQGPHTARYGTQPPQARHQAQQPQRASVTPVIKDDAPTPDFVNQYPENDDVMNLIHNVNASNSPNNGTGGAGANYDISSALDHLQAANNNNPLTAQQREDVLSMIAASGATGADATAAQPGANNALMMPTPPSMPSLDAVRQNKVQLDMLAKLQQEQDSKVADLAGRLQPLSPTGAIPGITASNFDDIGNPGDFDLAQYINEPDDNYFGSFGGGESVGQQQQNYPITSGAQTDVNDDLGFNWDYTQANGGLPDTDDLFGDTGGGEGGGGGTGSGSLNVEDRGGRVVGSVSSAGTSPPDATNKADDEETPSKKRRVGD